VLPLTFIVQIPLEGVGGMVPIIICFISLKKDQENFTLLNALLISATVPYVVSLLISVGVLNNYFLGELKDPMYILLEILLELTVILILRRISKLINLKYFLYQYSSLSSTLLLSFYYLTIQLFLYVAEYFKAYENFIFNIALFLIMQIIFLAIFFVKEIKKKKHEYKNKILEKQLLDFKVYAVQLEANQLELRKFKHDYKNLLLSLKQLATESDPKVFEKRIIILEKYSECYFTSIDWNYNDIENIKDIYLKSLFISKVYFMKESDIMFRIECKVPVDVVPIQVFDLVRILGVCLDNAIEAAIQTNNPFINVAIIKDRNQIEFIIQNLSIETKEGIPKLLMAGYSTKKGHSGLGLSNIEDIKKKYSNVYVQYEKTKEQFTVQIVLLC
jgi:two-component system sensor histidine kinase AgrC